MTIKKQVSENGREIKLSIEDRFDFSLHKSFRDAYSNCSLRGSKFCLDLSKTNYMDSSALGMILLLKDYAENIESEIVIKNPSESVHKVLEIAQFHRLMKIEL